VNGVYNKKTRPPATSPGSSETAESKADRLAWANREEKYADPSAPPPPGAGPSSGARAVIEREAEHLAYANREGKYADPSVPPPPGYDVKKTAGGGGRKSPGGEVTNVASPGGEVTNVAKRVGVGFLLGGSIGAGVGLLGGPIGAGVGFLFGGPIGAAIGAATASWPKKN
jgi:hypothetical protein